MFVSLTLLAHCSKKESHLYYDVKLKKHPKDSSGEKLKDTSERQLLVM